MNSYPQTTPDGRTIWACCVSEIGPACQHITGRCGYCGARHGDPHIGH